MGYGRFASFEEFLESYLVAEKRARAVADSALSFATRKKKKKRRQLDRNVVEVQASILEVEADDLNPPRHQHLRVKIVSVEQNDPDVEADVEARQAAEDAVFVSIRYGDRMGLLERIPNLSAGDPLHLRGEWITKDRAHAHGGEQMSVLHFTHDPIGFVCTETECFS